MARKSSVVAPAVALVLGLGVLIGGLASAQDGTEYLSCRFQEETDPFTVSSFTTQEEAIREGVGREVDLGDGPLDITVLRKTVTEDGDVLLALGINRIASAQVGVTSNGYAVSAYRTCA
jgi:ketosteroid isomerase-like protein